MKRRLIALEAVYTSDSISDIEASARQDIPGDLVGTETPEQEPVVIDLKGIKDAKSASISTEIDNNLTNITGNGVDNPLSMANEITNSNLNNDGSDDFDFAPAIESYDNRSIEIDTDIDTLDNGIETLSALGDLSEAARGIHGDNDSISDAGINILRISTEYMAHQLGLTGVVLVPSQEAMTNVNTDQILTIVQENISDTIKKGIKAIKDSIVKIWNKLVEFVVRIFKKIRNGLWKTLEVIVKYNELTRPTYGPTIVVVFEHENMVIMENVAKCFAKPNSSKLSPKDIIRVLENCFKLDNVTKNIGQTLINSFMTLMSDINADTDPKEVYATFINTTLKAQLLSHIKDTQLPYGYHLSENELEHGSMKFVSSSLTGPNKVSGHISIDVASKDEVDSIIECIRQNLQYLEHAENAVVRLNHLKDEALNKLEVDFNKLSKTSDSDSRVLQLDHQAMHVSGMFFGGLAGFLKSLLHVVFLGSSVATKYCNKCVELRQQSSV